MSSLEMITKIKVPLPKSAIWFRLTQKHGKTTRMTTYLCDGDSLLLHDLVHGDAIKITHLVKLINAHNPAIREHHRTSLKTTVPCDVNVK